MVSPEPQVSTRATASPAPATGSGRSTSSNGVFGACSNIAFMAAPWVGHCVAPPFPAARFKWQGGMENGTIPGTNYKPRGEPSSQTARQALQVTANKIGHDSPKRLVHLDLIGRKSRCSRSFQAAKQKSRLPPLLC